MNAVLHITKKTANELPMTSSIQTRDTDKERQFIVLDFKRKAQQRTNKKERQLTCATSLPVNVEI